MPLLTGPLADYKLTKKLRDYSVKNVKISEADQARSRRLVKDYIEDEIVEYCRRNSSLPILSLEYTGSVYERLQTEASDEVDVMVVLKTHKPLLWGDAEVMVKDVGKAGYALLKARKDSKLLKYASPEGYINPERLRNGWFCSFVVRAVNAFDNRFPNSDVCLSVRYHGPAVQVDITENETDKKLLSVDLVPCFEIGDDEYFVPKSSMSMTVPHADLLWRQSFSLKEKAKLRNMDRDGGCRHELLRIVKTIIKSQRTSLGALESYHVKSAFVHYIIENPQDWDGRNSLGKHFIGFLRELQSFLEKGNLPIYWQPDVNLLEDIKPVVLEKMANRLKGILNSEAGMNNILDSRIRLSQGEGLLEQECNNTFLLRIPQAAEGGMANDQTSNFSWLELGLELLQVLIENAIACIWFLLKIFLAAILFFSLISASVDIIIEEVEKFKQRQGGFHNK